MEEEEEEEEEDMGRGGWGRNKGGKGAPFLLLFPPPGHLATG